VRYQPTITCDTNADSRATTLASVVATMAIVRFCRSGGLMGVAQAPPEFSDEHVFI
jgi:hypothetical protein